MTVSTKPSKNKIRSNPKPNWDEILNRLEGAYADGTLRAYRADIQAFVTWCKASKQRPFPAKPKIVADFVTHEAKHLATSTLKRRLAAISKMHALLRQPNPISDEDVKIALRRALRKRTSRPRQALGLSHELRDALISTFDESLYGKRNKALVSVGYDILARRSELVSLNIEDIQERATILIRRSKNDPYGEGRLAALSPRSMQYVSEWLSAANIKTGPIFRSIKGTKINKNSMHVHSVGRILKIAAQNAKLPTHVIESISGHSMRIGAAQDMMLNGCDILPIMAAGGWKSINVVARYVEKTDLTKLRFRTFSR
jgi:integrase/recombinase XerD